MQLTAALYALLDSEDDRYGQWSREELEAMNARFVAAMGERSLVGSKAEKARGVRSSFPQAPALDSSPRCAQ